MLKLITITSMLFALLSSCNEEQLAMSTEAKEPVKVSDDANPDKTNEEEEPEAPVNTEENPAPKQWPKCWRSARLSTVNAQRIAGFGSETKAEPLFKSSDGRQELTGESKNPTHKRQVHSQLVRQGRITAKSRG